MSHGGVYNIANGNTTQIYGKTIRKLRAWYLHQWATGGYDLTPEIAAYLLGQVLIGIPPDKREGATLELVASLETIYDSRCSPRPVWLSAVREARTGAR